MVEFIKEKRYTVPSPIRLVGQGLGSVAQVTVTNVSLFENALKPKDNCALVLKMEGLSPERARTILEVLGAVVLKTARSLEPGEVLYGADPNCVHEIEAQCSGIKCVKCGGWYCV